MKFKFLFPLLLLFGAFACTNPCKNVSDLNDVEPIVFYTSLADTLPKETFEKINTGNVLGVKFKDMKGNDIRYFEYKADAKSLISSLSEMPFDKESVLADTLCRRIGLEVLRYSLEQTSASEENYAGQFRYADEQEFFIFECIKPPLKHTVLTAKKSNKVLHRIAYLI